MEIALIFLGLFWLLPIIVVYLVADSRGRSPHYVWWAVILGWIGAIIAMAVILVQAEKAPQVRAPANPAQTDPAQRAAEESRLARDRELRRTRGSAGSQWVRHYLNECADCTREGPACPVGRDLWSAAS